MSGVVTRLGWRGRKERLQHYTGGAAPTISLARGLFLSVGRTNRPQCRSGRQTPLNLEFGVWILEGKPRTSELEPDRCLSNHSPALERSPNSKTQILNSGRFWRIYPPSFLDRHLSGGWRAVLQCGCINAIRSRHTDRFADWPGMLRDTRPARHALLSRWERISRSAELGRLRHRGEYCSGSLCGNIRYVAPLCG